MHSKPLYPDDVQRLNEQVNSLDHRVSNFAKRTLSESLRHPDCFANSIALDWARKIVNRVNRVAQTGPNLINFQ